MTAATLDTYFNAPHCEPAGMTDTEIEWLADEILGYLLDGYEMADICENLTTGTEAGYREALLIVADAYCPARR